MNNRTSHIAFGLSMVVLAASSAIAQIIPHGENNNIVCDDCHNWSMGNLPPHGQEQETMCKTCHNPTGTASAMSDVANHIVHDGNFVIDCSSCHNPHFPHTTEDPHPGGLRAENLTLIRGDIGTYVPTAAEPALFQLKPEHFAFDDSNPPWNGICQTCHTQTNHHTNNDYADHEHQIGSNCTACHRHEDGFIASGDSCVGCHSQPQGFRRQIVGAGGDFDQISIHISGSIDDEDCITCHEMSKHQYGVARLKDPDSGELWIGSRVEWCLTCHDGDPPDGVIFPSEKGSGYDKSGFLNSTHDQYMGSNSCSHCHNAHGSSHTSLLKDTFVMDDYNPWNLGDGQYAMCWKCHDEASIVTRDNAFQRLHDRHVNGEAAPCFTCHDVHAPADANEPGLINLNHSIQQGYDISYVEGYDKNSAFGYIYHTYSFGYCYLTCHGKLHDLMGYSPKDGPATSCLPCHLPDGKYLHNPTPPYCSDCHWDDRPATPHPEFDDCTNCHGDPGGSWQGAIYSHDPPPSMCAVCHEDDRPTSAHSQDVDCANCHTDPGGSWSGASWDHSPTPSTCADCHEEIRPSSPHQQGTDCANCHSDAGGSWKGAIYDHSPTPISCAACHEDTRPAEPHPQGTDCANCHSDHGGSWAGATWNHTPPPSTCNLCHENTRPQEPHPQGIDCSNCHSDHGRIWAGATWDHTPTPSSCASCHEGSRPASHHPQKHDCAKCHDDPGGSWDREPENHE